MVSYTSAPEPSIQEAVRSEPRFKNLNPSVRIKRYSIVAWRVYDNDKKSSVAINTHVQNKLGLRTFRTPEWKESATSFLRSIGIRVAQRLVRVVV